MRSANVFPTVHEFPFPEMTARDAAVPGLREKRIPSKKGERQMSRNYFQISRLVVGLFVAGLSVSALAQSAPFPTYTVGPQTDGTFVASDGTIINPAGTQVNLGIRIRAKAIALNPTGNNTAAVFTWALHGRSGLQHSEWRCAAVLQPDRRRGRQFCRYHLYPGWQVPPVQPGWRLRPVLRCSGQRQSERHADQLREHTGSTGCRRHRQDDHCHLLQFRSHEGDGGASGQGHQPFGNQRRFQYSLLLLRFALLR